MTEPTVGREDCCRKKDSFVPLLGVRLSEGVSVSSDVPRLESFSAFVNDVEPHLRHALVGAFGPDAGYEAVAEALAYGWEHWERIRVMENPAGYLYRVAMRSAPKVWRRLPDLPLPSPGEMPWVEPGLPGALARLSEKQRIAVVLVRGHGYTFREAADLMGGIGISTVEKHVERGMAKLRRALEVSVDV
jgi:RNA polymerase sigma-70 factor (ECF subfamily)